MANITDKIKSHYQHINGGDLEKYHCEEWGTDIYYKSTYAFKDESKIIELQTSGKIVDALVESIIVKARKADGSKMFHDADRITLLNEADPQVIVKVASAINNASATQKMSQEQIAKE